MNELLKIILAVWVMGWLALIPAWLYSLGKTAMDIRGCERSINEVKDLDLIERYQGHLDAHMRSFKRDLKCWWQPVFWVPCFVYVVGKHAIVEPGMAIWNVFRIMRKNRKV